MAYTKIKPLPATLNKALDYIMDSEKTRDRELVSGYNVDPEMASAEFAITQAEAEYHHGQLGGKKGTPVLAWHMIQSFSPEDNVTPEKAHELGRRLANELLGGQFEYVIATHVDRGHIHNHIIFNATSFYTLKRFHTQPQKTAYQIRAISDRICAEADLSVIRNPQLGRSYQYSGRKFAPSWTQQIRRRLRFVLQAAESYEDFLAGAARLGVLVDDMHKDLTYQMEGMERVRRARALDKEGAFTREGIEEQAAANAQLHDTLREAIREAAGEARNCKEFHAALQRRGVTAKTTRNAGLRYTLEGETLPEWVLGPAYSTAAIQAVLLGTAEEPFRGDGSAMDGLGERFIRSSRSQGDEVGVTVGRDRVLRQTADGVLLKAPVPDGTEQLVFVDRNHIIYHEETDDFTVYLGNSYSYYAASADGQNTGSRIRGEDIIRGLQRGAGVQPVKCSIQADDVKAVSPKGLTLTIPELGIESIFIENEYVTYDRLDGGTAEISIYQDWSYRFQHTGGAAKYLAGRELAGLLNGRTGERRGLAGRISAMERRGLVSGTKQLADALLLVRHEGIESIAGFAPRLADLQAKQDGVQASIRAIQSKVEAYRTVERYLVAWHTYEPVKLEAMGLSGRAQLGYEAAHQGELAAWEHAGKELERLGVQPEIDPEKVQVLIREQDRELKALRAQADALAEQAVRLEHARDELQRAQEQTQDQSRAQSQARGEER